MSDPEKPIELIILTEKKDEEQILMEMKNAVVSQWVYKARINGVDVTNLSYAGVKEAVRRRGNFRFQPCSCCGKTVHVDEDDKEYHAQVTVHDMNRDVMFVGAAASFKNLPFAWVLAVNKAERNAFRKMLPEKQIALLVEEYLRTGTSKGPSVPPGRIG